MNNLTGSMPVLNNNLDSPATLRRLAKNLLKGRDLFVVSNREPYIHNGLDSSGRPKVIQPASGLVSALNPILQASQGTWIAHGSGSLDSRFVDSHNKLEVPVGHPHYTLKRVWLSKRQLKGYYTGFANQGLWPLCHDTAVKPVFTATDWKYYRQANKLFCQAVTAEITSLAPVIFIQDYHLALLPKLIRAKHKTATIELFWHVPWASLEKFKQCKYGSQLLRGLLACDGVAFHLAEYSQDFMLAVSEIVGCKVDKKRGVVSFNGHDTYVRAYPIGVDSQSFSTHSRHIAARATSLRTKLNLQNIKVAVSLERADYIKGITERLEAIDWFLAHYPAYHKKFVLFQVIAPSRIDIPIYRQLYQDISIRIDAINARYSSGSWQPVIYDKQSQPHSVAKAILAMADICIVSSLHDGMNLVAKEFVATRFNNKGVLLLSRHAGASKDLPSAVMINPRNKIAFAKSIKAAVDMPMAEQQRRMRPMRKQVAENNIYTWISTILSELIAIEKERQ